MTTRLEELRPFMPPEQKVNLAKIGALLGISEGAAVALTLCREAIRDYCPDDEAMAVVAALLGTESHKAGRE